MSQHFGLYSQQWPSNISELTSIVNKPFVGYCQNVGVAYTDIKPPYNQIWYTTEDQSPISSLATGYVDSQYLDNIGCIIFDRNVTSIDQDTFYERNMVSVILPNSVTSIGEHAFEGCDSLMSITIPNSVTNIGNSAFHNCFSLTSVTIGNGVTSIGDGAFTGCSSLTSITIPDGVTSIGSEAFAGCESLTSVTIPNSVMNIGSYTFDNSALTSITIGNSVESIGEYTFNCSTLSSIKITATTPPELSSLAFGACDQSIAVYIPNNTLSAYEGIWSSVPQTLIFVNNETTTNIYVEVPGSLEVLYYNNYNDSRYPCTRLILTGTLNQDDIDFLLGMSSLVEVDLSGITNTAVNLSDMSELRKVVLPNNAETIESFYNCCNLTSITIPESVISIDSGAFEECVRLRSVTIDSDIITTNDEYSSDYSLKDIFGSQVEEYIIGQNISSINQYAFSGCNPTRVTINSNYVLNNSYFVSDIFGYGIATCTIGDSVTSIGDGAFSGCSSLTSVTIPNSVTSIGEDAFRDCYSLASITIPNSVTSIGRWAFAFCEALTSVIIPSSITNIKEGTFCRCSSLSQVIIPSSVTSIEMSAFEACESLRITHISESVTNIGNSAFEGCNCDFPVQNSKYFVRLPQRYRKYTIPSGIQHICNAACMDCTNLTSITIPNSVISMGQMAFSNCTNLTSITIPGSVTSIGWGVLEDCTRLTSITCEATTPPTLGSSNDQPGVTAVYVPAGSVNAYKTATNWSYYAGVIQAIPS